MLKVDEFESAFRAASKEPFHLAPPNVGRVLVVTDLGGERPAGSGYPGGPGGREEFVAAVREMLSVLGEVDWSDLSEEDFHDVGSLLTAVKSAEPDLICSYRNLCGDSWRWPHGLGSFLEVLTTETPQPVLALPNPHERPDLGWRSCGTDSVMVMTDHLSGDDALVNWGVRLTQPEGRMWLAHVEDQVVFDRYLDVISKVPAIDTDTAREEIRAQLLKEPLDYIESTREVIAAAQIPLVVEQVVEMGRRIEEYRALVDEHAVDLLVVRAVARGQMGMHARSYPIAVELRALPVLLA